MQRPGRKVVIVAGAAELITWGRLAQPDEVSRMTLANDLFHALHDVVRAGKA